jgi:hypothetical protein
LIISSRAGAIFDQQWTSELNGTIRMHRGQYDYFLTSDLIVARDS